MPEYGQYTDNFIVIDAPVPKKFIGAYHPVKRMSFKKHDSYKDERRDEEYGQEEEDKEGQEVEQEASRRCVI